MNKRIQPSKLKLHHETVRALNSKQLKAVAGGDTEYFSQISECVFNQCVEQ